MLRLPSKPTAFKIPKFHCRHRVDKCPPLFLVTDSDKFIPYPLALFLQNQLLRNVT